MDFKERESGKGDKRPDWTCVSELVLTLFGQRVAALRLGSQRRPRRQLPPMPLIRLVPKKPQKESVPLEQRLLGGQTSAVLGPDYPFWVGDGADYCA